MVEIPEHFEFFIYPMFEKKGERVPHPLFDSVAQSMLRVDKNTIAFLCQPDRVMKAVSVHPELCDTFSQAFLGAYARLRQQAGEPASVGQMVLAGFGYIEIDAVSHNGSSPPVLRTLLKEAIDRMTADRILFNPWDVRLSFIITAVDTRTEAELNIIRQKIIQERRIEAALHRYQCCLQEYQADRDEMRMTWEGWQDVYTSKQ
jgi:hypothetical protein